LDYNGSALQKKILIIDDEAHLRRSLFLVLKVCDYLVTCAENAHDGMQLLEGGEYDLLFLDVKLPDGNGLALLPAILQKHPSLPVIILTAHGEPTAASEALKLGARAYLLKPIDPEEILARVQESLQ
jgi:two-component system OmpR family response regulator